MADYQYGQTKVAGHAGFDEAITLSMDFWTVTTYFNILTSGDSSGNGNAVTQAALDKLVEIISQRGQPVIMSNPTLTSGVCTLNFAIEHQYSWNTNEGTAPVYGLGAGATLGGSTQLTNEGTSLVNAITAGGVNIFPVTGAAAWVTGTVYTPGVVVTNASKYYVCVVGGTSAAAPTGSTFGTPITDGTVTWQYAGPTSGAAVALGSMVLAAVRTSL
jgi:hypothetical protein